VQAAQPRFEQANLLPLLDDLAPLVVDAGLQPLGLALEQPEPFLPAVLLVLQQALAVGQRRLPVRQGVLAPGRLRLAATALLLPLGLLALQRFAVVLELTFAQLDLAVEAQPRLEEGVLLLLDALVLLLQAAALGGQGLLLPAQGLALGRPVPVPALPHAAAQFAQPPPVALGFLLRLHQFALGLAQVRGHLGDVLLVVRALLLERGAGGLGVLGNLHQAAALVLQVGRQLPLLLLQGGAALGQARLLLGQGRLLGRHRRGLDAQGLLPLAGGLLGLRPGRFPAGRRRQPDAELVRADAEQVALAQPAGADALAVDESAPRALQVAQEQAVGALGQQAVQRMDAVPAQPDVAGGGGADEGERGRERAPGAGQAAGLHHQLSPRGGAGRR
jgi:hypothetical protein